MERKKDLRSIRTEKHLSSALLELLCNHKMEQISVGDICEKALVNRTTFYKHFSDKYDLFEHIIGQVKLELLEDEKLKKNDLEPKEHYKVLMHIVLNYVDNNKEILRKILQMNNDDFLNGLLLDTLERELEIILRNDNLSVPITIVANFYASGFLSLLMWWLRQPYKYSKDDMITYIEKIIDRDLA